MKPTRGDALKPTDGHKPEGPYYSWWPELDESAGGPVKSVIDGEIV